MNLPGFAKDADGMVNDNLPIAGNRLYCGLGGFIGYDFLHAEELDETRAE